MKITRISETKRGRYALFSQAGFLFSIDEETLLQHDLHAGSSLSDGELSALQKTSDTRKTLERALRLLARRAHSEREMREKLGQHHDEFSIDAAVDYLLDEKLLNDEAYAIAKAEYLSGQGRSRREIADRLRTAGVDRDVIEMALSQTDDDEAEKALGVLQKRYREKLLAGEREKVFAAMARRGFSQRDVIKAIEKMEQE